MADQLGGQSLLEHATAMYAPHGKEPDASLLYGLVYGVAGLDAVLWLSVLRPARWRSRAAAGVVLGLVAAVTGALALALLLATEYGSVLFPPLWGTLAALPPAVGVGATVLALRRG
jgi:hypothetical protein